MRVAPMISLGLSVVVGVLAVVFGRGWLTENAEAVDAPAEVIVKEVETQPILIANLPIERGDLLTIESFRETDWPVDHTPVGAITDISAILDEDGKFPYALGVMVPGEPVLLDKLSYSSVRDTLASVIEPGFRAASIRVDDVTGVAGFVLPDHRVDVNHYRSYSDDLTGAEGTSARTILTNVRVLGVDQLFAENVEGATPSRTVTLQVTSAQAKVLGRASQEGTLSLVLRSEDEPSSPRIEKPKPRPVTRITKPPAPAVQQFTNIRVIQGEFEQVVSAPVAPKAGVNGGQGK